MMMDTSYHDCDKHYVTVLLMSNVIAVEHRCCLLLPIDKNAFEDSKDCGGKSVARVKNARTDFIYIWDPGLLL